MKRFQSESRSSQAKLPQEERCLVNAAQSLARRGGARLCEAVVRQLQKCLGDPNLRELRPARDIVHGVSAAARVG
eukprot:5501437-Pleurochrysis_carterae.AAC.1